MKKFSFLLAFLLFIGIASTAGALLISDPTLDILDDYYVGSILPGAPASLDSYKTYMETLIGLPVDDTFTDDMGTIDDKDDFTYFRSSNPAPPYTLISLIDAEKFDDKGPNDFSQDVMNDIYEWVVGKYDGINEGAGLYVWFNTDGFTGVITLPALLPGPNKYDISNIGAFNYTPGDDPPPQGAVPEPTTMLLLGTGLIGMAGVGRKRFKK